MTRTLSGNFASVQGLLASVQDAASDLQPAWAEFGREVWRPRQVKAFESSNFVPLSARYSRRKFTEFGPSPVLVRSGALRDAATQARPTKSAPRFAVFGPAIRGRTGLFYGAVHQKGTAKYPRRPVVKRLTPNERGRLVDIIGRHILAPVP